MSCMLRYDLLLRVKVHGSYTCENMKFKAFQGFSRLFHGIINFKTILVIKKHKNATFTCTIFMHLDAIFTCFDTS